jgi:hypothetical protein
LTLPMPAANSGAIKPLSAASAARRRMALMRTLIVDDESACSISCAQYAYTVALVKPAPGPAVEHPSRKSVIARS